MDIGGTFTDFAIWRDGGDGYAEIGAHKLPTSRPDFAAAVIAGLGEIIDRYGIGEADQVVVVHGTTVSTNAVIERSQPPIALLTTAGFRDLLTIARLRLDKPVDLFNRRPPPLVPRALTFEVTERLLADGRVDIPLDVASAVAAAGAARRQGATAIALCFLHSYRNPEHERRAAAAIRAAMPDLEVMASHEVWPQQSEYERAVVTLLNAYVKRLIGDYVGAIEVFLKARLRNAQLDITKSNGGSMTAAEAQALPVHTLLSGPAAGVTAAQTLGGYLGLERILTMDMGGTSTDVSLIDGGRPMITAQAQVGDFPLFMPVTAIEAMGAGGGSVIWLDGGVLKVGPRSAGSAPGPACYGQGGTEPTLTDAYLVCGYLSERGLLGGRLPLRRALAEAALRPLADAMGMDVGAAADSAIAVATSNMLARLLPFLARLGVGPTDLTLMLYGGAGGLHGPILAEEIGIRRIVVPRLPSVFCAFGCLVADLVHDAVRSVHGEVLDAAGLRSVVAELSEIGRGWLERQSRPGQLLGVEQLVFAEMRYAAQSFTIPVDITAVVAEQGDIAAAFHRAHRALFGHANPAGAVALDEVRLRTIGRQARPAARPEPEVPSRAEPMERRDLRIGGVAIAGVPVFARAGLPVGWHCAGPAIIEQDIATVLVLPGHTARVGAFGDLELTRGA